MYACVPEPSVSERGDMQFNAVPFHGFPDLRIVCATQRILFIKHQYVHHECSLIYIAYPIVEVIVDHLDKVLVVFHALEEPFVFCSQHLLFEFVILQCYLGGNSHYLGIWESCLVVNSIIG